MDLEPCTEIELAVYYKGRSIFLGGKKCTKIVNIGVMNLSIVVHNYVVERGWSGANEHYT
jgi:hypothetical protein